MNRFFALAAGVTLAFALHASEAPLAAADPQLEKRAMAISEELRCLVCQNQTIADSNAPLAVDLREQVREQIRDGKSDAEIVDYMVQRYGDFVRYRPPVRISTLLLWFGPPALMLAGILVLMRRLRAARAAAAAPLTAEQRARADAILRGRKP